MKTIDIPKGARAINKVLSEARQENLILRTADGAEFFVVELDDFDGEIQRTRKNIRLLKFLDECARDPQRSSIEQVKRRLGLR